MIIHCILKENYKKIKYEDCFTNDKKCIHCSFITNFKNIAPIFENNKDKYCLLLIRESALKAEVKVEAGYPHIYGSININAIIKVVDFDFYKIFDNYKEIEYKKKYLNSTANLISKTWPYYKDLFIGIKDDYNLYKGIVELAVLECDYSKLIIDENGKVVAMFFATTKLISNIVKKIKFIFLATKYLFKIFITKNFGKSLYAFKVIKQYISLLENVSSRHKDKDVEVQLFITDLSIQGFGFGKKLMTDFLNDAKKNRAHSAFLLTDKGCNYRFYDHYGYTKIEEFHSDLLDKKEESINGFIYAMTF